MHGWCRKTRQYRRVDHTQPGASHLEPPPTQQWRRRRRCGDVPTGWWNDRAARRTNIALRGVSSPASASPWINPPRPASPQMPRLRRSRAPASPPRPGSREVAGIRQVVRINERRAIQVGRCGAHAAAAQRPHQARYQGIRRRRQRTDGRLHEGRRQAHDEMIGTFARFRTCGT